MVLIACRYMTKRQYRIETHPKINMDSFETTALWWYLKLR